jgi:hypothetical protein
MQRITDKQLDNLATWLNEITGSPTEYSHRDENGNFRSNIGNYHISRAYGGVCLHRIVNEGGGVKCPIVSGHIPKRELFEQMHAYIKGLLDAKELIKQEEQIA